MFQSVPIAALYLYNIQRENLVFKNSLSTLENNEAAEIANYICIIEGFGRLIR